MGKRSAVVELFLGDMGSMQRELRPSTQREDQLTMETKLEQIAVKAVNQLPKSVVREIRTPRSVGAGGGRPPPATRWARGNSRPYREAVFAAVHERHFRNAFFFIDDHAGDGLGPGEIVTRPHFIAPELDDEAAVAGHQRRADPGMNRARPLAAAEQFRQKEQVRSSPRYLLTNNFAGVPEATITRLK
jgi:hypothetical protein